MRISQKEDNSMESDPVIFILVIQRYVLTKVKYFYNCCTVEKIVNSSK
jgi:hypothetical protein